MKLKEAFRAQNCLTARINDVCALLNESTFEKKTKFNMLSKAGLGEDTTEEIISVLVNDKPYDFDRLADLAIALIQEKEKLVAAIEASKSTMDKNFDCLKQSNVIKQQLIYKLEVLNRAKGCEALSHGEFYSKDNEGKQTIFQYPVKTVKEFDFDKNHSKAILKKLKSQCEENSLQLDQLMVSVDVEYSPRFDYDSTIEDIYLDF